MQLPPRDYVALVSSLKGLGQPVPAVVRETLLERHVGDQERFWVGDVDDSRNFEVTATMWVQTEHVQMWVQDDASADQTGLERSALLFEEGIYPTNHHYFGTEWNPGIDGDPHLVVLNALFDGASGYFSSANEYSRLVNPYSNEHEMFVMSLKVLEPGTPDYDAVLAHEFQHMIQWYEDSNEDAWLSEGASELAEDLNGYLGPQVSLKEFENQPDVQLNAWSDEEIIAHYGASYLMMRYFLDRFGVDALRELVRDPGNGVAGFDDVLARRGHGMTFDELFSDWVVANALNDPALAEGRYGYQSLQVSVKNQHSVQTYPYQASHTVHQYGADYWELLPEVASPLRISFSGMPTVRVVPNEPASGQFMWWSNRGDASHSSLERVFDLTRVQSATLAFSLWYDIEPGWDYAYVRVSIDEGASWHLLRGAHMTDYNPNGNALGPGYSGKSGASPGGAPEQAPSWEREELDLGAYCGQKVVVRFDLVTDDAVNLPGLCLDDLELRAIGFADDVEAGEEGWVARGFVRLENSLPERYIVQVVELGSETKVSRVPVGSDGKGEWVIRGLGSSVERALLIISAVAPATTEVARYDLRLEQSTQ
jgi:hypothetical protein